MAEEVKNQSLRQLAKQIGISHSALVKISNGSYAANPQHVFKKIISHIQGVVIPAEKYDDILEMLNAARFDRFGETSRTAAWLYNQVEQAKRRAEK